jgi:hypothetical protein
VNLNATIDVVFDGKRVTRSAYVEVNGGVQVQVHVDVKVNVA